EGRDHGDSRRDRRQQDGSAGREGDGGRRPLRALARTRRPAAAARPYGVPPRRGGGGAVGAPPRAPGGAGRGRGARRPSAAERARGGGGGGDCPRAARG